jgi:hypothetical protein
MDNGSVSYGEWYDFVWSRTRSIRKDITQQHLCDLSSVALTEKCARFHIHCAEALCEENIKDFDPKINEENLSNCLQSLKDFYYDLSLRDIYCENEAEFRSYEILLHLNDAGILRDVKNYRKEIRDSPEVKFAIQVFYSYQSNNYINFFKLAQKADYLILRKSYTSNSSSVQEYPNHVLISSLGFENDDELIQFCDHIGLECSDNIVYLIRGINEKNVIKAKLSMRLVEDKRKCTVGQVINGIHLPLNPFKSIPVHNSFDSDGRLKSDAYEALDQQMKTNCLNSQSNTFEATVSDINNSTKPLSGSLDMPKPRLNALSVKSPSIFSSSSKILFGSSPSQESKLNFSLDSIINQESKPNAFSFTKPSPAFQFPQNSQIPSFSLSFNIPSTSSSDGTKPIQMPPQIHINQVSIPEPMIDSNRSINEEMVEKLCHSVSSDLIDSVSKELLVDICGQELEKIRKSIIDEIASNIFADILLNVTNHMIEEITSNTIREEKQRNEEKIIIEKVSNQINNDLINNVVESQIKSISEKVYNQSYEHFVEKQNEMIAKDIFNDSFEIIVKDIATEVIERENNERKSLVKRIQQNRCKRLMQLYFNKWKNWYLRRKRHQYYKKCFPAAPNWNLSTCFSSPLKSIPQKCYNNSVEELIEQENELLANHIFNVSVEMIIEEIVAQVLVEESERRLDLVQQIKNNRSKRLQQKYFDKWKNSYLKRKRHKYYINSFPAAPNWNSTDRPSTRIKYSFSEIDSDIENCAKKFKRESDDKIENKKTSPSGNDLRALFDEEVIKSKDLTKRLSEVLDPISDNIFFHSFTGDKSNIDFNLGVDLDSQHMEEEDENEVTVIYETSTDKMNRIKRILSEQKDDSFNHFISYLTTGEYESNAQQIESNLQ